jgi:signal transduction histidine kinase
MMHRPRPVDGQLDAWEVRLDQIIRIVPYVSLGFSVVMVGLLGGRGSFRPDHRVTIALVGAAALWMLWWVTLHPAWRGRRTLMVFYYAGLVVFIAALVVRDPLFGFFAFAGYLHAVYALWGAWRLVGVGFTAFFSAASQIGDLAVLRTVNGLLIYAVVLAYNLALVGVMTFLAWITQEQALRRRATIDELAETNSRLAEALAENAGLHAQLITQAREAGVLDERQRMAREIHDTIAQGLIGIVTHLEAAACCTEPAQRHIQVATRLARDSLTEARRSVHALRPQELDTARLPDALASVVERWADANAVPASVTHTGDPRPLRPEIEVALVRVAQEALANAARHASATRVGLTVSYMEDLVTLDVRDDGIGFDPSRPPGEGVGNGFGLPTMAERMRAVGGSLTIESQPGAGTAISASAPAFSAGDNP